MNFGSGIFINNNSGNYVVRLLVLISPFRYSSEAIMRTFLNGKENTTMLFDFFNYNEGYEKCLQICLIECFIFFIMSWIAVVYKAKKIFK